MNRAAYEGVTDLADFENVMYKIDDEDAYLIATSEHPMAAMYSGEIFEEKDLPTQARGGGVRASGARSGHTGSIRRGSSGSTSSTRWNTFIYCHAGAVLGTSTKNCWQSAEEIFQRLGLPLPGRLESARGISGP